MRLLCFALLALVLSGCATSRQSSTPLPAVTLGEVNGALDGRTALVTFADGRAPVTGRVTMGPEVTVIRSGGSLEQVERVETAAIETVTIDVSMSPTRGALHGAGIGAAPGAAMALAVALDLGGPGPVIDLGPLKGDSFQDDWRTFALQRAAILAVVGAAAGAGVGAATTASRDDQVIYRAPITQYPDAALALLERRAEAETSR